jgi:enterochelin esterase-like enzyme
MPTGPASVFRTVRDTSAGPIKVTTLAGKKSGVTGKVWVWLPPEYSDPKYAHSGFPVITLYPGGEGNGYNTWTDPQLPIQEIDAQLAKAGKAHPFIMVMPIQQLAKNLDTECSDVPGHPKIGTWMAEDLPDFARANFRTLPGRDGFGLMGASAGAFCSVKLAMQHPDTFKAAVPIDGYFAPESPLFPRHADWYRANNPTAMAASAPDVKLLVTSGTAEAYERQVAKDFVAAVKPPTQVTYYELPGGRHLTSDFKKIIPTALKFLTANLQGPSAA